MTANYESPEMVEAIEGIVRASRTGGLRPVDVKQALERRWPGWRTPSLRTIERHLNKNPQIMKKPDTTEKRRSHCRHAPFTFGYYVARPAES